MKDTFEYAPDLAAALGLAIKTSPAQSVCVDLAKYRALLDDPALSDADKDAAIVALWNILVNFVDLGFGIHPVQEACGKLEESVVHAAKLDSDGLESPSDPLHGDFNASAGVPTAGKDG